MTNKRVIITGGGTGGHIFPAIAIANAIKVLQPDTELLFVGAEGKLEMQKVPVAGYKIEGLPVRGLKRSLSLSNIKVIINLVRSITKAKKIIKQFKPNLVVGVGGYASAPVLFVAGLKQIPSIIQEQNSYAGITNRMLSQFVKRVCVAYPNMERFFDSSKIVLTGNPVRKSIVNSKIDKADIKKVLGISNNQKVVLFLGGSGGAGTINETVVANLDVIRANPNVYFILQSGKYYYDTTNIKIQNEKLNNISIFDFINKMDEFYAISDLVVSRSGAGTISELSLLGKPAVFIPSPNVAENHQFKNAEALASTGAAIIVSDEDAVGDLFSQILSVIYDTSGLAKMSENIKKHSYPNADSEIAKTALEVMRNN